MKSALHHRRSPAVSANFGSAPTDLDFLHIFSKEFGGGNSGQSKSRAGGAGQPLAGKRWGWWLLTGSHCLRGSHFSTFVQLFVIK